MTDQRTILFFPEGAEAPVEACARIGDVLLRRGHRVVFILDETQAGSLEDRGFEERHLRLSPEVDREPPERLWADLARETAAHFRRATLEQLEAIVAPTWQVLVDVAQETDERLATIVEELDPHAIVQDTLVASPAIAASGRPWVRLASSQPTERKDPLVPPFASGYPSADRTHWAVFLAEVDRTHRRLWSAFRDWLRSRELPGLQWHETGPDFMVESPWLNLSVYPEEADYRRLRPLGPTWHRLPSLADSAARGDAWRPPPGGRDVPVVHLALGSLGSSDLDLMQRLLDTLDGAAVRVIAETGPLHEQLTLPANAAGEPFLPLSLALPHADLVITSGGNHAVTEALHHGKPLIVLPLFGEQHDNAQRVAETGLGVRLAYGFRERELLEAIGLLQGDRAMGRRIADVAARAQATDGVRLAAELIERVAVGRDQPAHALT